MQRRIREDGAERQFEGGRGSEPVFGRGGRKRWQELAGQWQRG
jgi:hypothetical protein